jgi:hypothetical protein
MLNQERKSVLPRLAPPPAIAGGGDPVLPMVTLIVPGLVEHVKQHVLLLVKSRMIQLTARPLAEKFVVVHQVVEVVEEEAPAVYLERIFVLEMLKLVTVTKGARVDSMLVIN